MQLVIDHIRENGPAEFKYKPVERTDETAYCGVCELHYARNDTEYFGVGYAHVCRNCVVDIVFIVLKG